MADAYLHRPPYPRETFDVLRGLCVGARPHRVLDLGAGNGALARGLVHEHVRVDALEPSDAMRAHGMALPGGDAVRWIAGTAESAQLDGPYDLITAAESIHWMDWGVAFPRLAGSLAPGGMLAVVERIETPHPWFDEIRPLIAKHSTNAEYQPYDPFAMLHDCGWFEQVGEHDTATYDITQSIDERLETMHSRNGFSRDRMPRESAQAFDAAFREILASHGATESVTTRVHARMVWGRLRAVQDTSAPEFGPV